MLNAEPALYVSLRISLPGSSIPVKLEYVPSKQELQRIAPAAVVDNVYYSLKSVLSSTIRASDALRQSVRVITLHSLVSVRALKLYLFV